MVQDHHHRQAGPRSQLLQSVEMIRVEPSGMASDDRGVSEDHPYPREIHRPWPVGRVDAGSGERQCDIAGASHVVVAEDRVHRHGRLLEQAHQALGLAWSGVLCQVSLGEEDLSAPPFGFADRGAEASLRIGIEPVRQGLGIPDASEQAQVGLADMAVADSGEPREERPGALRQGAAPPDQPAR